MADRLRTLRPLAPTPLAIWVTVQVTAAAVALLAVAISTPLRSEIAFGWPGLEPGVAITAGLTFWLAFGLVGGIRTRLQPGGGIVTFSMPFIVAGAVLGGPLAGGLMGLVSELEVRELRTRPWYGLLSNHAVGVLAAIVASFAAATVRLRLTEIPAGQDALAFFVAVIVAGLVFTIVNVALVVPTIALRNHQRLDEAFRTSDAAFRATTVAEIILAWNLAVAYQAVGWWAPIAIAALVLAVWQAFDRGEELRHDRMTGVLNELGFGPRLDAAIRAASLGKRTSAFLSLDLDGLWEINLRHGSAGGDEFLRVSAQRMLRAVRATDSVCRRASTGDEFWIVLDGVADMAAALRVAERIRAAVCESIHIRGGAHSELITGGVSIGVVLIQGEPTPVAADIVELGERRLQKAKVVGDGAIVHEGNGPGLAELDRHRREKDERRRGGEPHAEASRRRLRRFVLWVIAEVLARFR